MSARKVHCPGCTTVLNIAQALPANLRCPKCQSRFHAGGDGRTALLPTTASSSNAVRLGVLAAIGGGFCLFLVLGVGLLAYCLLAGGPKTDPDEDPPQVGNHHKSLPLEPVAFVKKSSAKSPNGAGAARAGKPGPDTPAGVAKNIASDDVLAPANQKEIDAAIAKGVAYLKSHLDNQGHFVGDPNAGRLGAVAMVGLTLLSCGVAADNPKVAGITKRIRQEAPNLMQNYDTACCIWYLDKLDDATDVPLIRKMGLRLMANQQPDGAWIYDSQPLTKDGRPLTKAEEDQLIEELQKQPLDRPGKGNWPVMNFTLGQKLNAFGGDNSVTQFAVLGLWVAQKHGVPAQRSLAMVEARFRQSQAAEGSWGYHNEKTWRDAMTCAGLVALATGKGSLPGKDQAADGELKDPQMDKALHYVGDRIAVLGRPLSQEQEIKVRAEIQEIQGQLNSAKPEDRDFLVKRTQQLEKLLLRGKFAQGGGNRLIHADCHGDLYFLWSVERVAVLYDLRTIGGHDWHAWGADILLHFQQPEGSWADIHGPAVDTCFALLFLKRVNVAHDLTKVIQGMGGVRDPGAKPGQNQVANADTGAGAKINPTLLPGAAKIRGGYALPANNQPNGRARRRSKKRKT